MSSYIFLRLQKENSFTCECICEIQSEKNDISMLRASGREGGSAKSDICPQIHSLYEVEKSDSHV